MKPFVLVVALFAVAIAQSDFFKSDDIEKCQKDPIPEFKYEILLPFTARVASEASFYSNGHFIISAHTIWLSLAAVAESTSFTKGMRKLWKKYLYLPKRKCVRDQIYQLALTLEAKNGNESSRHRALAIDNTLDISEDWIANSESTGILENLRVNYDEKPFGSVQEYMGIQAKIPLTGHSVFLDRLDWNSVFTPSFADEAFPYGSFYNEEGVEIAKNIQYIRARARVRVTDIPNTNIRVVELPVGADDRYSMILAVGDTAEAMIEAVFNRDILSELELTEEPLDVVIPNLVMSSSMDLRPVLRKMGFESVFNNPDVTSYISEPAAMPMGYLQRVDVNITGDGLGDWHLHVFADASDIVEEYLARFDSNSPDHYHFIANRPFLFSLFETRIGVPVFTGVYSKPGKRGQQELFTVEVPL